MKIFKNTKLVVGLTLGLLLIILIVMGVKPRDTTNTGGDYLPDKKVAFFINAKTLFVKLGTNRYEYLQKDVRAHFDEFVKDYNQPIQFTISSVSQEDTAITITGKYSTAIGQTTIKAVLLRNERMSVAIKSDKGQSESGLPSNNKLNQYIAKLPIAYEKYDIDFLPKDNKIMISLYVSDPSLSDTAYQTIVSAVGSDQISYEDVSFIIPPASSSTLEESDIADFGNRGDLD